MRLALSGLLVLVAAAAEIQFAQLTILPPSKLAGKKYLVESANFSKEIPKEKVTLSIVSGGGGEYGCGLPTADIHGALSIVVRGNCTFFDKASIAAQHGAAGVLVVNTEEKLLQMGSNVGTPTVFSAMIAQKNGKLILSNLPLSAELSRYTPPPFDGSIIILFILAVGTVIVAAYWGASTERKTRHALAEGLPPPPPDDSEEEVAYITETAAWCFIVIASIALLALFFFVNKLIYLLLVVFCIGGTQGMVSVFFAIIAHFAPNSRLVQRKVNIRWLGEVHVLSLYMTIPALALAVWWFAARKSDYSWVIQNIMCICILLMLQKVVRLPNIKVAAVLLTLAFFYDIFFVFLSPYVFKKSVMVEVATGGDSGEDIPMLLKVPHFGALQSGEYALLGMGDIALPGLLVSFLLRFDYMIHKEERIAKFWKTSYFVLAVAGYAFGVVLCDIVLVVTRSGQPALLYLVPCTLGVLLPVSKKRGHLKQLWSGRFDGDGDSLVSQEQREPSQQQGSGAGRNTTYQPLSTQDDEV